MNKSEKESLLIQKILKIPLESWIYIDPRQPGDEIPEEHYVCVSIGGNSTLRNYFGKYIVIETEKWNGNTHKTEETYSLDLTNNPKMEEVRELAINIASYYKGKKEKEKEKSEELEEERRKQDEEKSLDNILKLI